MKVVAIEEETFKALIQRINSLEKNYGMIRDGLLANRLYTTEEACEIMGIGTTLMQKLRDSGRIAYTKLGGKLLYNWQAIQDCLESNKKGKHGNHQY